MEEQVIEKLIGAFMALPGVGYKTAQRYAYSILTGDELVAKNLANSIVEAKQKVKFCSICGGFSTEYVCPICKNRTSRILCVVKSPQDINVIERVKNFDCNYHVLHGCISPLENKGPEDIRLKELLKRLSTGDFDEVIVATNPDVEGEATAMYISKILKPLGIKVTRLAQGIAIGSDLEYADEITLSRAIETRREI
jgi:recombination protein RecR